MKHTRILLALALAALAGCDSQGPFRTPWHAETLASGKTIKVTSFNLVWGAEHDPDHTLGKDCFAIEYVTSFPDDDKKREAEIVEVFEALVRSASEQWRFGEATVAAMPTLEGRRLQDLYWFVRQPDGHWASKQIFKKGEWIQNSESTPPH